MAKIDYDSLTMTKKQVETVEQKLIDNKNKMTFLNKTDFHILENIFRFIKFTIPQQKRSVKEIYSFLNFYKG